jgi:hypothetical protein
MPLPQLSVMRKIKRIQTKSRVKRPLWAICGQSNCTGLGIISSAPAAYQGKIPNSYIWSGSAWPQLEAGVNNDAASVTQFGPELSFAKQLVDTAAIQKQYIVKYQASGRSLAVDFLPTSGTYYVNMINKIDAAIANLNASGENWYFAGFVWIQGENDANTTTPTYWPLYNTNFTSLVNNLRTKYSKYSASGTLPVVVAQLGPISRISGTEWYFVDGVRQAVIDVAATLPEIYIAKAEDLTVSDANVHYDTNSYITLGNRLADQARKATPTYAENRPAAFGNMSLWYEPGIPFTDDGATNSAYCIFRSCLKVMGPGQATAGKKPTLISSAINGQKSLSFDGGDVYNAAAAYNMTDFFATNAGHFIILMKVNTVTQGQIIQMNRSGGALISISSWDDGNIYFDWGTGSPSGRLFFTRPAGMVGNFQILELVRRANGEQEGYVQGISQKKDTGKTDVIAAGTGTLNFWMGALTATPTSPFNGEIAHLAAWNRELTSQERTAHYAYLNTKYATGISV